MMMDVFAEDAPDIAPGEVVHNENGDLSYRIISQIGAGRCCVVYKAVAVRDDSLVALKCFHPGPGYDGAIDRERTILETFLDIQHNIVTCYAVLEFRGYTFFVLELLQDNVRQLIFKNDRRGLSPWLVVKFARDLLTSLQSLHSLGIVHADLKPHNILWSGHDSVFKLIDFGLSYNVAEEDLHQVQSVGYRAPETEAWNNYKESRKLKRRRKLDGSYQILNNTDLRNQNIDAGKHNMQTNAENICDKVATNHNNEDDIKDEMNQLQHNDSHSSGYFSQDNSEQSHVSLREVAEDLNVDIQSSDEYVLCNKYEDSDSCINKNVTDEADDKLDAEMTGVRKTRRKSSDMFLAPARPGPASDMWSYGCVLCEVLTGRKLFQVGDKLSCVLRPAQLLEMKIGDTETLWTDLGHDQLFHDVKDLIIRCISEDPSQRITSSEASKHSIFSHTLSPASHDQSLLPTTTLQFVLFDKSQDTDDQDLLEAVKTECQQFGSIIIEDTGPGGHPLIQFHEVERAIFTRNCLTSNNDIDTDEDDISQDSEQDDDIVTIRNYKFRILFYL